MQNFTQEDLEIDPALIRRFDIPGPRYTSYPTADRFVEAFNAETYKYWLKSRTIGGSARPLSIYVHIPFCENICYYCACNKIITRDHGRAGRYVRYLQREIALQAAECCGDHSIRQLHWGGGTPTFLSHDEMQALMESLRDHFPFQKNGEYSIEIDPRGIVADTIGFLAGLGFNRVSLGVQDFDPEVQKAVHRIQSYEETMTVLDAARRHGFASVNLDLIYGLPKQHIVGFNRTLDLVIAACPDRISLYNYAHLPEHFKAQRRINAADLPDAESKLQMLIHAIHRLTDAGYVYIGMDHFARPEDDLAIAQRQAQLQRGFQGYSTGAECDVLALGITGIGKLGPAYSQNVRTLPEYYDCLDQQQLPIFRGLELTPDDHLRHAIIQQLMCNFTISIEAIEIAYLIEFWRYFAAEQEELMMLADAGLITINKDWLTVTPRGRLLVRRICMAFDKYLRQQHSATEYSKVI